MKDMKKMYWYLGAAYACLFALFLIFIQTDKDERSGTLILSAITTAVATAWLVSYFLSRAFKRQLEKNGLLGLDLEEDERMVVEELANYKLYGGKLILTTKRLCYVQDSFWTEKLMVNIPVGAISKVQIVGKKSVAVFADGKTFRFRLENVTGLHEKIDSLKV